MDDLLSYGLIVTIGFGATTIASAVVGDPFPVVLPAIVAVLVVAGHYHQQQSHDDEADQAGVHTAVEDVEQGGAA